MAATQARMGSRMGAKALAVGVLTLLPLLGGCGNFFVCEGKSDCGTSGSGTGSSSTADVVLVGESASGTEYINGYGISSGAVSAVTGSPFLLDYVPTAMAITPNDEYLYAAAATGEIYSYTLSTAGVPSNGTAQATVEVPEVSMAVSPNSDWLFSLDSNTGVSPLLRLYSIGSDGVLAEEGTVTLTDTTGYAITPSYVAVSPDGDYVAVSMGTGGVEILPFDQSTGSLGDGKLITPPNDATGDNAIAWDSNDYLYIAQSTASASTTGVFVYAAKTGTVGSTVYETGAGPRSMVVADSSAYLYVGNESDSTISEFSISSGTLTAISTQNLTAPTDVASLTQDQTGKYVIAAGYNSSSGVQVFSIGTGGLLTLVSSEATLASSVTTPAAVPIAATH